MKPLHSFCLLLLVALGQQTLPAQTRELSIDTRPVAPIQSTMYGIFFEDINFGADGGLYAEMVENRSFEYPNRLMGWTTMGNVNISDTKPAYDRCPHYAVLEDAGHRDKLTALENQGLFGMALTQGRAYDFVVTTRLHRLQARGARFRVELIGDDNQTIASHSFNVGNNQWQRLTASLTPGLQASHGRLRLILESTEGVDVDHISLMPHDNWQGLRADLVKDLEDLHPGIFRFPGGCIVEGADLATRYQWKNTVGPAENRPINENRWNYCFRHRLAPNYYQSGGLGFYEFFLLSEKIGAEPLPVLNCGMACQYQNPDSDSNAHVALADLQPYIDDALDLIEFANGDTTTRWGSLRASMGHPQPFGLKQIAIGNEQWGQLYTERLESFVKALRKAHPEIKICGSAGPSPDGPSFDYGWQQMRRLGVDLVDEHYYMSPQWFLDNAGRYDNYSRKGPKVFAGEYACHVKGMDGRPDVAMNDFEAALSEAAFMTGLERNADVVWQATYAPLFARREGWQWRPDLIWFDNTTSVRTVNWHVQQLFSINKGTHLLRLTEDGKPVKGQGGLYASAVADKPSGTIIIKVVNTTEKAQEVMLHVKGWRNVASTTVTTLHADSNVATNSFEHPHAVEPVTQTVNVQDGELKLQVGSRTLAVIRLKR